MFNPAFSTPESNFMPASYNIRIPQLLLIPAKPVRQMVKRDMAVNVKPSDLNGLRNVVDQSIQMGRQVSPVAINNISTEMIGVSNIPSAEVGIDGGWGQERLQFMMEVVFTRPDEPNKEDFVYVQGYTSHNDPTRSGLHDPNMIFYINSVINVIRTRDPITGAYNVMSHDNMSLLQGANNSFTNTMKTIRPSDVFNGISTKRHYDDSENILDTRMIHNNLPKTVSRENTIAPIHMATVLTGYMDSSSMSNGHWGYEDQIGNAVETVRDPGIVDNLFLNFLAGEHGINGVTTFKMSDVQRSDPNAEIKSIRRQEAQRQVNPNLTFMNTHDTASLATANVEAKLATELGDAVISIMGSSMISSVSFSATNETGKPVVAVINSNSFISVGDNNLFIRHLNQFEAMIRNLVFPKISANNMRLIRTTVTANLFGDITINMGINGGPMEVYRIPTYADSLFSLMIAPNNVANTVINDYATVLDTAFN